VNEMNIIGEMFEVISEVSDEVGEQKLRDGKYIIKYEGWSATCMPSLLRCEQAITNYALRKSVEVHAEWRNDMAKRGYVLVEEGHDKHQGLYGVTYALYCKRA